MKALSLALALVLLTGCSGRSDDSAEGSDEAVELFENLLSISESELGPADIVRESVSGRRCGDLGGPTGRRSVELVAQWSLGDPRDPRVAAILGEADAVLQDREDVETLTHHVTDLLEDSLEYDSVDSLIRHVLETGQSLQIVAVGSTFDSASLTGPGIDYAVFQFDLYVTGPCSDGPFPDFSG